MVSIKGCLFLIVCVFTNALIGQNILLPERQFSEKYFEKNIFDPYRYMEKLDDTLVHNWFKQNSLKTRALLDNISGRKEIVDKLLEIESRKSYNVTSLNITDDDFFFYLKKTDKDKTEKLYYKKSEKGTENLLFDPVEWKNQSN